MAKHELWELRQWQALPISVKIRMTQERIRNWVDVMFISRIVDKN